MLNSLLKNQKRYTLRYNFTNLSNFISQEQRLTYKTLFSTRIKVKHRLQFSTHPGKEIYDYNFKTLFDEKTFRRMFSKFTLNTTAPVFRSSNLWNLFDIHFLRKEKIYTKLKYSRVPQYDIVSAGVAAIFAALLGYLITEKFGFELLDSGDFYYLFMYAVFTCFFIRMFLKITNNYEYTWNAVSYKWALHFYRTISVLLIRSIRTYIFKKWF